VPASGPEARRGTQTAGQSAESENKLFSDESEGGGSDSEEDSGLFDSDEMEEEAAPVPGRQSSGSVALPLEKRRPSSPGAASSAGDSFGDAPTRQAVKVKAGGRTMWSVSLSSTSELLEPPVVVANAPLMKLLQSGRNSAKRVSGDALSHILQLQQLCQLQQQENSRLYRRLGTVTKWYAEQALLLRRTGVDLGSLVKTGVLQLTGEGKDHEVLGPPVGLGGSAAQEGGSTTDKQRARQTLLNLSVLKSGAGILGRGASGLSQRAGDDYRAALTLLLRAEAVRDKRRLRSATATEATALIKELERDAEERDARDELLRGLWEIAAPPDVTVEFGEGPLGVLFVDTGRFVGERGKVVGAEGAASEFDKWGTEALAYSGYSLAVASVSGRTGEPSGGTTAGGNVPSSPSMSAMGKQPSMLDFSRGEERSVIGFGEQESGVASHNRRAGELDPSWMRIQRGMVLVRVNGRDLAGETAATVQRLLRSIKRPIRLTFRLPLLRELQRRYASLAGRLVQQKLEAAEQRRALEDDVTILSAENKSLNRHVFTLADVVRQLVQLVKEEHHRSETLRQELDRMGLVEEQRRAQERVSGKQAKIVQGVLSQWGGGLGVELPPSRRSSMTGRRGSRLPRKSSNVQIVEDPEEMVLPTPPPRADTPAAESEKQETPSVLEKTKSLSKLGRLFGQRDTTIKMAVAIAAGSASPRRGSRATSTTEIVNELNSMALELPRRAQKDRAIVERWNALLAERKKAVDRLIEVEAQLKESQSQARSLQDQVNKLRDDLSAQASFQSFLSAPLSSEGGAEPDMRLSTTTESIVGLKRMLQDDIQKAIVSVRAPPAAGVAVGSIAEFKSTLETAEKYADAAAVSYLGAMRAHGAATDRWTIAEAAKHAAVEEARELREELEGYKSLLQKLRNSDASSVTAQEIAALRPQHKASSLAALVAPEPALERQPSASSVALKSSKKDVIPAPPTSAPPLVTSTPASLSQAIAPLMEEVRMVDWKETDDVGVPLGVAPFLEDASFAARVTDPVYALQVTCWKTSREGTRTRPNAWVRRFVKIGGGTLMYLKSSTDDPSDRMSFSFDLITGVAALPDPPSKEASPWTTAVSVLNETLRTGGSTAIPPEEIERAAAMFPPRARKKHAMWVRLHEKDYFFAFESAAERCNCVFLLRAAMFIIQTVRDRLKSARAQLEA
jgi:hypothetical protein